MMQRFAIVWSCVLAALAMIITAAVLAPDILIGIVVVGALLTFTAGLAWIIADDWEKR